MLEHAQRPTVGAVGAQLLFPDNTLQHAGVVVGIFGVAGHAFRGLDHQRSEPTDCRRLQILDPAQSA